MSSSRGDSLETQIAIIDTNIGFMLEKLATIEKSLETDYATNDKVNGLTRAIYGIYAVFGGVIIIVGGYLITKGGGK